MNEPIISSITIFLPTRKGSERVKNKNTRPFSHYKKGGLLELKLKQLLNIENCNEIILSSDDPVCLRIGENFKKSNNKLRIIKRPDILAQSDTDLVDLINHASDVSSSDHILWTHVTSPFITDSDYRKAIELYFINRKDGYDSLMSVKKITNYVWNRKRNDIINRKTNEKWPRTQDLETLYEINNGIFITSKKIYFYKHDRIGEKPFLHEMNEIKSFDIDWESDFYWAEKLINILNHSF